MNKLLKYPLFLFISAFAACSSEDDIVPPVPAVQPQSGDVLELTVSAGDFVTDGAPDTRATDNDKTTTFESSDRVGVIILNEDGQPIYNNIPYKYNSNKWVFDSDNGEGKDMCYYDSKARTYIVYYPYHKDADGCKSENDLKAKFVPQSDQSTKDNYRASDLMVCTTTFSTPQKSLAAELKHAYASVYLTPVLGKYVLEDGIPYTGSYTPNVFNVNLTIGDKFYVPYQTTDGYCRCIVPAGITSNIRCFYTIGGKTYSNTISGAVAANTRYTCAPTIRGDVTYSLDDAHVGDFYCKTNGNIGYLIPGDVALTPEQQAACIGIVFKAGMDESDNLDYYDGQLTSVHGYVIALENATSSFCEWGDRNQITQAESVGEDYESIYNGYRNTKVTIDEFSSNDSWHLYTVFHAIIEYNDLVKVPENSTNWYLPSLKQLADVYNVDRSTLSSKLETYGKKFYGGPFWSSTQKSRPDAWHIRFDYGYKEAWSKGQLYQKNCYARAILTF